MITLPRSSEWWPPRGYWVLITLDGHRSARITCPDCGECYVLDHNISAQGVVSPSVKCPTEKCSWHVNVTLEDWDVVTVT